MGKISALLVATALAVLPASAVFAADTNTSDKTVLGVRVGTDKDPKVTSETNMTGRGKVDPTGKPTGAYPLGPASGQTAGVPTGRASGIGRGDVTASGRPMEANVNDRASMAHTSRSASPDLFSTMDANGDKIVSRDEYMAYRTSHYKAKAGVTRSGYDTESADLYARRDRNKDGQLSASELQPLPRKRS